MTRLPSWLLTLSLVGCGGDKSVEDVQSRQVVIAPFVTLSQIEKAEDHLSTHRPESVDCNDLTGWYVEDGVLEVNTAECDYLALVEPAAAPAHAGEILKTRLSFFDLTAPEASSAHIALMVETDIIWEQIIPIPTNAQVLELAVELDRNIQEGDLMGIHLHNHGQNTWNLTPLFVERER